jgi:two-component sensor histidine kinase
MGVLYDKLYRSSNFSEISIKQYMTDLIYDLVRNFPDGEKVKIENNIEDIILDVNKLQQIGIIINELITNIMKYAFDGIDNMAIKATASLKDNIVTFTLEDNGNSFPESIDFENSTSFGIMLIKGMTKQINGRIQVEKKEGTKIILEFSK